MTRIADLAGPALAKALATQPQPRPAPAPAPLHFPDWRTIEERGGWLEEPPPARRWLLRRDGKGAVARGIAGLLVAPGGRGKTWALVQLAIAVATGRDWLEAFAVDGPGRVVLALAEEPEDEVRRRLFYAARALDLTPYERGVAERNIVPLGLAGSFVGLVSADTAGAPVTATPVHAELVERLGQAEHDLVILDPLARWAPDVESSNAQATAAVQALEMLTRGPGNPTVVCAHHSPKSSRREGNEVDHAQVRGVTGLVDAVRWVGGLGGVTEDDLHFAVSKSNYSAHGAKVPLVRTGEGHLRPPTAEERAAARAAAEVASDERLAANREVVLAAIVAEPGLGSASLRRAVKGQIAGGNPAVDAAVASLIETGEVEDRGSERGRKYHPAEGGCQTLPDGCQASAAEGVASLPLLPKGAGRHPPATHGRGGLPGLAGNPDEPPPWETDA